MSIREHWKDPAADTEPACGVPEQCAYLLQNMCNKLRAEVIEFALIGNPQKRQKQPHGCIVHAALVCNEIFNLFFDLFVGFRCNFDFVELDGEGLASRFEIAGQLFDAEAFEHEAVKDTGVLFQTKGDMGIIASG